MPETAQLLVSAKIAIAAESGTAALRAASEALAVFQKNDDKEGTFDASLVIVSALLVDGQAQEALKAVADLALTTQEENKLRHIDLLKADVLLAEGKHEEALELTSAADEFFQGAGDRRNAGKALLAMSKLHVLMGNSKLAVQAAEKAAACYNNVSDDSGEASAWASVSSARFAAGDSKGACSSACAALALYSELGDKQGEAIVQLRFAQAQLKRKMFAEALPLATQALSYFRTNGGGPLEFEALTAAVRGLIALGQASEAASVAKQSLASARRSGTKFSEGLALACLARAHGAENWPEAALQVARDALIIFQDVDDKIRQAQLLREMVRWEVSCSHFEAATGSVENALTLFKELGDTEGVASMEQELGFIEETSTQESAWQLEEFQKNGAQQEMDKLVFADLVQAMKTKDSSLLTEAWERLFASPLVSRDQEADIIRYICGHDVQEEQWFVGNLGKRHSGQRHLITSSDDLYCYFRFTGMHYGPGFRLNNNVALAGENPRDDAAWGLLHLFSTDLEPNHSWETLSWWHPGILDCALQVNMARDFASHRLSVCRQDPALQNGQ